MRKSPCDSTETVDHDGAGEILVQIIGVAICRSTNRSALDSQGYSNICVTRNVVSALIYWQTRSPSACDDFSVGEEVD